MFCIFGTRFNLFVTCDCHLSFVVQFRAFEFSYDLGSSEGNQKSYMFYVFLNFDLILDQSGIHPGVILVTLFNIFQYSGPHDVTWGRSFWVSGIVTDVTSRPFPKQFPYGDRRAWASKEPLRPHLSCAHSTCSTCTLDSWRHLPCGRERQACTIKAWPEYHASKIMDPGMLLPLIMLHSWK